MKNTFIIFNSIHFRNCCIIWQLNRYENYNIRCDERRGGDGRKILPIQFSFWRKSRECEKSYLIISIKKILGLYYLSYIWHNHTIALFIVINSINYPCSISLVVRTSYWMEVFYFHDHYKIHLFQQIKTWLDNLQHRAVYYIWIFTVILWMWDSKIDSIFSK